MCGAEWENLPKTRRAMVLVLIFFFYLCACSLIEPPYVSYFSVFSVCFFSYRIRPALSIFHRLSWSFRELGSGLGCPVQGAAALLFNYGLAIASCSFHVFGPRPVLYM